MNIERHMTEVAENDAIRGDELTLLELLADCNPVRRGATWKCKCPVHAERTPSCEVRRGRDGCWRWKCFGCGKGGDAFDLVVAVEGCTFRQARERLGAKRAAPAMPPQQQRKAGPPCTCARMEWGGPRCQAHRDERAQEPDPTHVLVCERRGCCGQQLVTLLEVAVMLDRGEAVETDGEIRWVCRPCVRELRRDRRWVALYGMLAAKRTRRERVDATMTQARAA